jgi:hypothetical protein
MLLCNIHISILNRATIVVCHGSKVNLNQVAKQKISSAFGVLPMEAGQNGNISRHSHKVDSTS